MINEVSRVNDCNVVFVPYLDLCECFRKMNDVPEHPVLHAFVRFAPDNFSDKFQSWEYYSYCFKSNNNKFCSGLISSAWIGDALDGSERAVRLDYQRWFVMNCWLTFEDYSTLYYFLETEYGSFFPAKNGLLVHPTDLDTLEFSEVLK